MGLNIKEMENDILYEFSNDWYVMRPKNNLYFPNDTIFVYGFDEDWKIKYAAYGELIKDNEISVFTINGWKVEKGNMKDEDYSYIGDPKKVDLYRYGIYGLHELKENLEAELKREIISFWLNPKKYFDLADTVYEDNTVDGLDPIDWEEVIKNNIDIAGRKRH